MKKNLLIMIITLSLILVIGSSYAYLMYTKESNNNYVINVGTLEVTFVDSETEFLNLTNMYPMTDDEGKSLEQELVFQVKNTGNVDSYYDVSIEEVSTNPEFKSVIKYIVNKDSAGYNEPKVLGNDKYIEAGGLLKPNGTADYRVKVWLSEEADNTYMNKEFKAKVVVKGNQGLNLDKSGANPPKLLSNMLPVYYDAKTETDGVWKIADKNNHDETNKWYDYDNFMWANAVTVKETNGTLNSDSSMTFDGVDDYLDLGHENYDFKDKISVVLRLKIISYTSNIGTTQASLGSGGKIALGIDDGNYFYVSFHIDNNWRHLKSTIIPSLETWYTIVGTYDGKTEKIYVNGQLSATKNITGNIDIATSPIYLGKLNYNVQQANSTISDAFVYTDALTDSEIKEYFSGEITDYPKDNLLIEKTEFNELDTRQKYLEASAGTEIPMDDITSMWVWIPRYKYTIFNGNNGIANEQMINVEFENGIETTGTVSCHDDIKTDDDSDHSEICEDKTNGKIIDMKSTYTHPAFTFGDDNLTGFWFSKFAMSTDDTTCLSNPSVDNCNKYNLNIYIKPDQNFLRYQSQAKLFASARNMEVYGNIHGFSQSEDATNYLDIKGNLSGEIANDSNTFDTHLVKNMEYGAILYLSMSKYGKYNNSLYKGEYKEIYSNSYYDDVNYKTGYSSKQPKGKSASDNVLYNNLTITEGRGYEGSGASTTGTIYGIYDMSGRISYRVMGLMADKNGKFQENRAEVWNGDNVPNPKYYNLYSYSTKSNNYNISKLGDAEKEIILTNNKTFFQGYFSPFYSSSNNFWRGRGTGYTVFTTSIAGGDAWETVSGRSVLTIS